ncbi:N-acetylglucosamine kinase [Falsarthrobacter nasiphocae]|uniref:N-acetylglucosamine kinase-like BadF-type ATPase n=1 Tax=Falsarthrobacter nasiphocae TaxID=189863 RepID=A0AAE4C6W1_9MICC|nr:BadF/BadG/BcrA/BcrD ATPase family protein [Falsarthrobacter nasiphocae]MDR6892582.1 N-acetylglucosamine kinase-like BadF-type ATPase [Falsarthrobacter nasiphocae]
MGQLRGSAVRRGDYLGIDIGGTKTSAVLASQDSPDTPHASARAGSANVQNVSREEAAAALASLASQLESASPGWAGRVGSVVIGAGGVDTPEDAARLASLASEQLGIPRGRFRVVHDTRLILAANHHDTGIGVILGTGSVAWGVTAEGRESRSGGWGYLLGDEGSAWWFGREAVRESLRAFESEDDDALVPLVVDRAGVASAERLIGAFHEDPSRTRWAGLAPVVFEAAAAGSARAAAIIEGGVEAAADLIVSVADRLGSEGPVVCGGGLVQNQPSFASRLAERLAGEGLPEMQVLEREPVMGALYVASR